MAKNNRQIVTYQIGVDVLGFPVYMEHTIICETQPNFIKFKKTLNVFQRIFKQH
ncbi:hypothetical protein [Flavobacterium sp.]|uniref:hypothetical protein n=1 Tax=Flavobacterium sp. TaxID=239 RepID=UPI002616A90C|nr:hypothetical protein [Flavobacterium sp.]